MRLPLKSTGVTEEWVICQCAGSESSRPVCPWRGHRDHQRVAAGAEDETVAVDERALAGVPFRDRDVELADQVNLPAQFTGDSIAANEMALGPRATTYCSVTAGIVRDTP